MIDPSNLERPQGSADRPPRTHVHITMSVAQPEGATGSVDALKRELDHSLVLTLIDACKAAGLDAVYTHDFKDHIDFRPQPQVTVIVDPTLAPNEIRVGNVRLINLKDGAPGA